MLKFAWIVTPERLQDTNKAQNELVLMLAGGHGNVCVVGDTDQSVNAFRGADFRNILEFEDAFPDVTTIVLDQNYRSTQTILDAANAVIDHNEERKPKSLWTDGDKGDRIVRYFADDDRYDLKEMFHREKLSTAEDQNSMMARLARRALQCIG